MSDTRVLLTCSKRQRLGIATKDTSSEMSTYCADLCIFIGSHAAVWVFSANMGGSIYERSLPVEARTLGEWRSGRRRVGSEQWLQFPCLLDFHPHVRLWKDSIYHADLFCLVPIAENTTPLTTCYLGSSLLKYSSMCSTVF